MRSACVVAALIALGLTAVSAADDWPHFRPDAGVAADDPRLPDTWGTKENVAWKVAVPGLGWGSPIVWGEHVFVTSVLGDDTVPKPGLVIQDGKMPSTPTYWQVPANANYRWMLYDFDFKTGKLRWERELKRGAPLTPRYHKNSFATETPVTDGQRVYVFHSPAGLLAAVDFSGQVVWTRQIDQPVTSQADVGPFGPGASPAIHRNRLFLVSDEHPNVWWLAAFDTQTASRCGESRRRKSVASDGRRRSCGSTARGPNSYGEQTAGQFLRFDGNLLWHLNGLSGSTTPTPFAADGLLYASSGYPGAFRPVYAIRPGARGDITLKEGETSNEFVAWSNPALATYLPSPIVYRNQLCSLFAAASSHPTMQRLARRFTGVKESTLRRAALARLRGPTTGGFRGKRGRRRVRVEAGPQFKILHKNSMGEMIHTASPAIVQGSLIIRTVSSLWKIARRTQ